MNDEKCEAEVWDDDKTRFKSKLLLQSETFCPKPLFDTVPSHTWFSGIPSPSRAYLYANRILPAGQRLKLALSPMQEGTVEFDAEVVIPTLFDLGKQIPEPWMSITPQEIITQRPGIQRASGTVMVGGLGLGWFLRKVHDRDEVERVILVEKCQELLDWYGYDTLSLSSEGHGHDLRGRVRPDWAVWSQDKAPARHLEAFRGVLAR